MSSSSDEEDEAPPPLDDVSKELSKLGVKDGAYAAKPAARAASKAAPVKQGMRRGFFDAPRKKPQQQEKKKKKKKDGMVEIKAWKGGGDLGGQGSQTKVPEWMKIDPNSDQAKLMQMKEKVADAMKPTADMMQNVMQNPDLMKGFDNPEVMQAVNDIAKNPENIKKYQNNPQVMAFYQSMAGTMAKRFEQLAEDEERNKASNNPKSNASARQAPVDANPQGSSLEEKLLVVENPSRGNDDGASPRPASEDFKPLIEEL
ncbi:hypothetical protein HOP50_20g86690 [Chloropicon primus]|uniref:STI1 domain-containing protein n=2 Tax=Chloropicon primus TaxID=1764295 RepID=A0A5B8N1T9_9CHLO|nr:hypothetical protein A3770_20p86200 [Chloropicon primus]UPR05319.1 hypothetical protein HOP50_20g86690 [Chloropicon primus]|eukprot:QDZ26102.1 hypothetical protein A3770_20p86200 [Chloropicon primus]